MTRERTPDEEELMIFSNLKRLHDIEKFPENTVNEGQVLGRINVTYCGIDKSGKGKLLEDFERKSRFIQHNNDSYEYGVMECKHRNYFVISYALKGLTKTDFMTIMPFDDFKLKCSEDFCTWEDGEYLRDWTSLNSVDICMEILKKIRKMELVNALEGDEY